MGSKCSLSCGSLFSFNSLGMSTMNEASLLFKSEEKFSKRNYIYGARIHLTLQIMSNLLAKLRTICFNRCSEGTWGNIRHIYDNGRTKRVASLGSGSSSGPMDFIKLCWRREQDVGLGKGEFRLTLKEPRKRFFPLRYLCVHLKNWRSKAQLQMKKIVIS